MPDGQLSNGLSGTKNSALKKPVASVPSSGLPCCDTTVMVSGELLMIRRISLTGASPASSEMEVGMVARIHKLPSSSFGKNSRPSERVHSAQTTTRIAMPPKVISRFASASRMTGR